MALLDPVLTPLFQPLLNLSPFWGLVILAFLISLIITLVYKYATNQNEMKRLKERQKEYQKRMKTLRSEPEQMMKVQKEAMGANMEYMKHSFKAMIYTFIPIILIFGWMSAHLVYDPIMPGDKYEVQAEFAEGITGVATLEVKTGDKVIATSEQKINSKATWRLTGTEGLHTLTVKTPGDEKSREVLVTTEQKYIEPISEFDKSDITKITVKHDELKPFSEIWDGSLYGWKPGWLGTYILFSILFSIVLRKWFKVY